MATSTGTVTIHGASGISSVLSVTNDAFGLSLASSFQSLTAQLVSSPSGYFDFLPGSSFVAVENGLGKTGLTAPSGAVTVLGSDGGNLVYNGPLTGTSNTAVIIGGNGDDTVSTGAGSDTVALGAGHNGIVIGDNGSVDSAGTDTVIAGLGTTTVTVSGANSYIGSSEYPGASLNVDASAGTNTTIYTVSNATVTGASVGNTTIDGYGPTTVFAGAGGTTYSGGQAVLNGSKGETDNVTGAVTSDTLYGASGTTINFTGSTSGNIFVANDPAHTIGGTVRFDASSATGNNQFWAGSGNATLIGGTGSDILVGGNGASTLQGGSGAANFFDLFSVNGGSGTSVTINDFGSAAGNTITLFGYGASGVSSAVQNQAQSGGNTTITLGDGSTIKLLGVTHVTGSNFLSTEPGSST